MRRALFPYAQIFVATLLMVGLLTIEPRPLIQQTVGIALVVWLSWGVSTMSRGRFDFYLLVALGVMPAVLELMVPWAESPLALDLLKGVGWIAFPLALAGKLFTELYRSHDITHHELMGAVSVYMFLGLAYANAYEFLGAFQPHSLAFVGNQGTIPDFADYLYFSFVTLGTVGYGDVSPTTHGARLLAMSEALVGVMYIAVVVGRVVGLHTALVMVREEVREGSGPFPGGGST
jgi:hypothetical protein